MVNKFSLNNIYIYILVSYINPHELNNYTYKIFFKKIDFKKY